MSYQLSDEERTELTDNLRTYLGRKDEEEELRKRANDIKKLRSERAKRILQVMAEREIPRCTSADFPYTVSLVKKKRTTPLKIADLWKSIEEVCGADMRTKIDKYAKDKYCSIIESQSLKLTPLKDEEKKRAAEATASPSKRQRVDGGALSDNFDAPHAVPTVGPVTPLGSFSEGPSNYENIKLYDEESREPDSDEE